MVAPNRYDKQVKHNIYGIKNWFRSKGIEDEEVIKEVMHAFCEQQKFTMDKMHVLPIVSKFIQNRFHKFGAFAIKYLKDNNYDCISS